jgi:sigma-B regulation protein RsbU (phosphoserine phosphatase)
MAAMTPPPTDLNLLQSLPGRLFLLTGGTLSILLLLQQVVALPAFLEMLRRVVALGLIGSMGWLLWVGFARNRRRFLWRVRRKLLLSYVLLGLTPVILVAAFALVGGVVLYTNVTQYVFREGFNDFVENIRQVAETTAGDVDRFPAMVDDALSRRYESFKDRFPSISFALVPIATGTQPPAASVTPAVARSLSAAKAVGAWRHEAPPAVIPDWVRELRGFTGVLSYTTPGARNDEHLLIRSAVPAVGGRVMIVVDLPIDTDIVTQLDDGTGTRMGRINFRLPDAAAATPTTPAGAAGAEPGSSRDRSFSLFRRTVAFMDYVEDWQTGHYGRATIEIYAPLGRMYGRMLQPSGDVSAVATFLFLLTFGILFLIIQGSALLIGGLLARSITSAVHELFTGTERIRQGDFAHRIRIDTNDQLGDLADSFNRMSGSIEHLLHVQREKQRLDDELRIARDIQKSLLPTTLPALAGLTVADLCEPAREVGGDYYDFFELGGRRIGVLVADVSGKGTSAALYMAELKGLMLALSHAEPSPRKLLIDVNRRLVDQLDNRSFITMTYAVIDLDAGTLTCARAGHTPLIVVSGGKSDVIVPQGMVVGLRIPGAERRFEDLLQDHTREIRPGDLVVLYTDGITEAMDAEGELFGDAALARVLAANHHLEVAGIRERVLREVRAFVGDAEPHDDMTMIVLKIGAPAA